MRRARADVATRLTGADANLRGSPEEALAITLAGLTHGAHGHIKWLSKQILTDLSEEEFLVREADVYGLERTAAVQSHGELTIVGVDTTVCPAGTIWARSDGVTYTQDADVTISGGQATADLTAVEGGTAGDAVSGTKLTIASAVAGITSTATVSGDGLIDGSEIETVAALRARLLARKRNPPKAGGPGDYVAWALEVSGVTRAWEYPLRLGPGTVGVFFVRDNDVAIVPDAGEIADVQDHIDSVRPVTAEVVVLPLTAAPLNFTFTSLTTDDADTRAAIEAELEALISSAAEPESTLLLSQINEAISIAAGETDHVLSSPAANVTASTAQIITMGTITWPS